MRLFEEVVVRIQACQPSHFAFPRLINLHHTNRSSLQVPKRKGEYQLLCPTSSHTPTMMPHALSTNSGCAPGGRATTSCCCSRGQPARVVRAAALHEAASQLVPQLTDLSEAHAAAVSLAVLASQPEALQPGAAAVTSPPAPYTPGPVEVGWQIWFAAVVSTIPFVIGRAGRMPQACSGSTTLGWLTRILISLWLPCGWGSWRPCQHDRLT